MKKLILLCLAVILLSCSSDQSENSPASNNPNPSNPNESELSKYIISECSDFVKFHPTDPTFLNYLISKGYDLNNDLKISCDEASKVIDLDLGNTGYVKILNGIEYLKNLKSITGYVDLGGYYPNSTTENTLNLYNNSNLEEVYLTPHKNIGNGYIPIIVLPKDSRLKKLDCSKSSMDRILNLSAQPNLKFLDLKFSVSALTGNSITDEVDISGSSVIETIHLSKNPLKNIKFSTAINPFVKELNVNNNNLSSINLEIFPNLEVLDISFNGFTSIDISKNPKLTSLNISNNGFLNLDMSKNKNINILKIDHNLITNLKTSDLLNLGILHANNNLMENLDFSNNKKLSYLQLDDNALKTLNLNNGMCVHINGMSAKQNKLTCIKIDAGYKPNATRWFKDANTKYCN